MSVEIFRQGNFTNGELDPQMVGRRDIKPYFASLASATNLLQSPQGPINRRPGLTLIGPIRNPMAQIDLTEAVITAPNGGTVTYVRGGNAALATFTGQIAANGALSIIGEVTSGAIAVGQLLQDDASLIASGCVVESGAGSSWVLSDTSLTQGPQEPMATYGAGPISTTAMEATNPYVFLEIDLGAPTTVSAVDLTNIAVVPAGSTPSSQSYTAPPTPETGFPYPIRIDGYDIP